MDDIQKAREALGSSLCSLAAKVLDKPYAIDVLMTPDSSGWTPIHWAIYQNLDEGFLRRLLAVKGLRFDCQTVDGNTPLHYFCSRFTSPDCQEIFEMMIENGAEINHRNTKDNETGLTV